MNNKIKVLLLDGDHKNALAILRHLGTTKEYQVDVVSNSQNSLCFYSKYLHKKIITVSPKKNEFAFINQLLETLKNGRYDVLIPVSFITFQLCSKNIVEITQLTNCKLTNYQNIMIASSKIKTNEVADKIGIPIPKTKVISKIEELENINITYPCVIKAPDELGKNVVDYAYNNNELIVKYKNIVDKNELQNNLPIIQEYIDGFGAGFFAFYDNGECKSYFMHKRIREYPVTGGASTVAEGFKNDKILFYGKALLDNLKWDGVAMVEFKYDSKTKEFYLMEINAKFWGSLELALVSGINFPYYFIKSSLNQQIEYPNTYKLEKFQWILNGDLLNIIERPSNLIVFFKDLIRCKNDIYINDILPNLFQLIYIPIHYYKKFFK